MKKNHNSLIGPILCYGEVLWDLLPDGPQPGGAPLNVAYHLNKLGLASSIISKIGNDLDGKKLKQLILSLNIDDQFLQEDEEYATSEVLVRLNKQNEASYDILYPVAWDFIQRDEKIVEQLKSSSCIVFGSLCSRNPISYHTLLYLLDNKTIKKIFDVNLRAPFISKPVLQELLLKADVVKFNHEELRKTSELFGGLYDSEFDKVKFLQETFTIQDLIVTKGSLGASYYNNDNHYSSIGPKITVQDTIGSGDAFLAAFIWGHLQKLRSQHIIDEAVAMGAFIATKKGGCPDYQINEYMNFKNKTN